MKPIHPKAFIAIHWMYVLHFQDELNEAFRILFDKTENGQDCKLSHLIPALKNTELRTIIQKIFTCKTCAFFSFKCYHLCLSPLSVKQTYEVTVIKPFYLSAFTTKQ